MKQNIYNKTMLVQGNTIT